MHQVKDLDRGWLKHTLKVYASLEVFVKEEVFGLKKDEEEDETDEEADSDNDESEEEEVDDEADDEEESGEDDEGSEEEESEDEKEGDGGLEPFWDFVFMAREIVDD